MQGTGWMRTRSGSVEALSVAIRSCAPAIAQDSDSQTRMVTGAGAASPSRITSKWW